MVSLPVTTIVFDFGGVLLDLHFERMAPAFARLGAKHPERVLDLARRLDLLGPYERGEWEDGRFRRAIAEWISLESYLDADFDAAFCAWLGGLPKERLDLLVRLKQKNRLCLLSNTNAIHIRGFLSYFGEHYPGLRWPDFFDEVIYSHDIGLRKPEPAIFTWVAEKLKVSAGEILFVEDNPDNAAVAREAGWQTVLQASNENPEAALRRILSF